MNGEDNKPQHDAANAAAAKSLAVGQSTNNQAAFAPPVNIAHPAAELARETSPQGRYVKVS